MNQTIKVKHTATRHGDPLAVIDGLPGSDADLTPAQLRQLAAVLTAIADDSEVLSETTRRRIPVRREYSLVSSTEAADDAERIEKNGDAGGSATYSVGVV